MLSIKADACGITVADNGPGLPQSTLESALDFSVRASNREAYVAPDRGAQGNAMKTLLPMPRVLDPERGRIIIPARLKSEVLDRLGGMNIHSTSLQYPGTDIVARRICP